MSSRAQRLDAAARRLVHPAARLAQQADRMRALGRRLARAFAQQRAIDERRIATLQARLLRELRSPLPQAARVQHAARALERAGRDALGRAATGVQRLGNALALLDPEAVLDRGYAIVTTARGDIVNDASRVSVGERVGLRFARGSATATVDSTALPDSG